LNMGTVEPTPELPGVMNVQIAPGTEDFTQTAAMTELQLAACLQAGASSVPADAQLFIAGEMGIGNTTSASAIYAALFNIDPAQVVGRGTGVDEQGLVRKREVVRLGLEQHEESLSDPVELLRCLGGLEIAAMVGAYIAAAQRATPILVDGFISTAAAAVALAINPSIRPWMMFAHSSAEHAHQRVLQHLGANSLLQLDMRLGEGSGAAVAVSILRTALRLHNRMSTFADVGVSTADT